LIALDNMVLGWAVRAVATIGQEDMILRAQAYLQRLEDQGTELAITTPALAEFMVPVPQDRHLRTITVLKQRFVFLDFDVAAAASAAEVMARNLQRVRAQHGSGSPGVRQGLKTDALILGTCRARGVRRIISDDAGLRAMAEGFADLEVLPVPPPPPQMPIIFTPTVT
jgi:predicted nucleic acid-binding protein